MYKNILILPSGADLLICFLRLSKRITNVTTGKCLNGTHNKTVALSILTYQTDNKTQMVRNILFVKQQFCLKTLKLTERLSFKINLSFH